jgi:hypothetical protein
LQSAQTKNDRNDRKLNKDKKSNHNASTTRPIIIVLLLFFPLNPMLKLVFYKRENAVPCAGAGFLETFEFGSTR